MNTNRKSCYQNSSRIWRYILAHDNFPGFVYSSETLLMRDILKSNPAIAISSLASIVDLYQYENVLLPLKYGDGKSPAQHIHRMVNLTVNSYFTDHLSLNQYDFLSHHKPQALQSILKSYLMCIMDYPDVLLLLNRLF